jgi:septal ring-binding cell division protein DamX
MATETPKYPAQVEEEPRHSALAEFSRDERRPAVLLLSALLLSALFFGIGLMVGRWTAGPNSTSNTFSSGTVPTVSTPTPASQSATSPTTNATGETSSNTARRFSLLVATYDSLEKAQTLIKTLQEAGYTDIRTTSPRPGETRPRYSVLVGRFTQDEARQAALRMRTANNPQLKNARMIEDSGQ